MKDFFNQHPIISLFMVFGFYMTTLTVTSIIKDKNYGQNKVRLIFIPSDNYTKEEKNTVDPKNQEG